MQFDPTKPVRTREGDKARIIATDRIGEDPIVALVMGHEDNEEELHTFQEDGSFFRNRETGLDLVNVPEQITEYRAIYVQGPFALSANAPADQQEGWVTSLPAPSLKVAQERNPGALGWLKLTFEGGLPVSAEIIT